MPLLDYQDVVVLHSATFNTTISIVATLFILMAGFSLLEVGSVRSKNASSILLKNLLNLAVGSLAFFFLGGGIALGKSVGGVFGRDNFLFLQTSYETQLADPSTSIVVATFTLLLFSLTASTIMSGAIAERTNIFAYVTWLFFSNLIFFPLIAHWVSKEGWLTKFGYVDVAGSGTVHIYGGVSAAVACTLIGPRIGRLQVNSSKFRSDLNNLKGHSVVLVGLGCILLFFGFFGFNGASTMLYVVTLPDYVASYYYYAYCSVNICVSASSGCLTVLCGTYLIEKRWSVIEANMGLLCGSIATCASTGFMPAYGAVVCGNVAGILYIGIKRLMPILKLDDPVDAIPVHMGAGTAGVFCCSIFFVDPFEEENSGLIKGNGSLFYKQLVGFLVIVVVSAVSTLVVFFPFKFFKRLRVSQMLEVEGIDKSELDEPAYPEIYAKGDFILFREYLQTHNEFNNYVVDQQNFKHWNSKVNMNKSQTSVSNVNMTIEVNSDNRTLYHLNNNLNFNSRGVVEGRGNSVMCSGGRRGKLTSHSTGNVNNRARVLECSESDLEVIRQLQKVQTGMEEKDGDSFVEVVVGLRRTSNANPVTDSLDKDMDILEMEAGNLQKRSKNETADLEKETGNPEKETI